MWLLLSILSGLGSALMAVVIKMYLRHIDAFLVACLFFIIATIFLLIGGLYTKKISYTPLASLTTTECCAILAAGLLHALAFTCYLFALKYGDIGKVVAIDRLGIVYVVILSIILLKEQFTYYSMIGAILMVFGAFLLNK